MQLGLKLSPFAVLRPACQLPYQDAIPLICVSDRDTVEVTCLPLL